MQLNSIYNMDCLEGMAQIETNSIDMILSDWPYGMTRCAWDQPLDFVKTWGEYRRIIKQNGAIVLTSKQPFTTDLICSNRQWFRYNLIWLKNYSTGFLNAKRMPLQSHEEICVFYQRLPAYHPQMDTGFQRKTSKADSKRKCKATEIYNHALNFTDYDSTDRYPISVLYFESDKQKEAIHPTQKPVALFEYLIKTYTNEGETVFDGCAGIGTTAIACLNTKRNYILMEKDPDIFRKAQNRVENFMLSKDERKS